VLIEQLRRISFSARSFKNLRELQRLRMLPFVYAVEDLRDQTLE
jgi:hypothetical protein